MKYSIGTHTFDSERLIFYPSSYDEYTVSIIESAIPSNDRQKELSSYVSEFDPNNMQTKSIFIYHGGICLTYNCQLRCNYCSFRSQEENKLLLTEEDIRVYARYCNSEISKWFIQKTPFVLFGWGRANLLSEFFPDSCSGFRRRVYVKRSGTHIRFNYKWNYQ